MIYVIKRNGVKVPFDKTRIINAINKAMIEVDGKPDNDFAEQITKWLIADLGQWESNEISVEAIQDKVESYLMECDSKDLARAYVRYRYKKEIMRQTQKVYDGILELVDFQNEELKDENSNKNAIVASTQRDYMAGEVSKDLSLRYFLPQQVAESHKSGEIHFHDMDYFAQHIPNCCLVNLEDMLQNGTVINKTKIEKPHSFSTACTIATQIMAVVASGQYGGQSISLAHLAPFVDISRQKILRDVEYEIGRASGNPELIKEIAERRLQEEITRGAQTMQYQINTLNTSNGQTPFVTLFMYLNEARNQQEKDDLALIIEEILRQRIQGIKNEVGVWVTPAFPKLIYVLEEDNAYEGTKYWELTQLAAKCTAKRLVPDYISEKIMKELKLSKGKEKGDGDCYAVMGCRSALTPDRSGNGYDNIAHALNYEENKPKYYGRLAT